MNDIYVVGDVHGDFKKLIEALIASNWDEKTDKLIFVGDVVDRGIENAKVVNFIADHKDTVHLVLGNHEYEHRQKNHKVELRRFISVISVDMRQPTTQYLTDVDVVFGMEAVPPRTAMKHFHTVGTNKP